MTANGSRQGGKRSKPAILCLHGGGTSAEIFKIQTVRLRKSLEDCFEFIFINAPFEAEAGPGVSPVFDGCDPFYRWIIIGSPDKPKKTDDLLKKTIADQKLKDGRGFVGVLGFSQGAKTAAGLLLEQQLKKRRDGLDTNRDGFAFGVILCGTTPPLTVEISEAEKMEWIDIPTVHALGKQDPWRESSRHLYSQHFDPDQATLLEFDVGHRLPVLQEDTTKLAAEIIRMHRETSGF